MQPSDKAAFIRTLMGLSAIKPGKELTAEALDLYWNAMQAWSIDDFKAAANQLARTSEFMPNPYHFEQLRKAGRATAGEAWAHVLRYVRSGSYRGYDGPGRVEPPSDDVQRAVDAMGGYKAIADGEESELHFREKAFASHLAEMRESTSTRQSIPQLGHSAALITDLSRKVSA